ncbi:MAG: enoyl-[acyl-carrier-protein] reductase FabK [Halanaerobiaceae bacterium]
MKFKTDLCSLLEIDYPIIQGGMAWVATGELAAAVSEAGGLGLIGSGNAPAEIIKEEIEKVRELTDKPFGVNIMFLSPFAGDIVDLVIEKEVPIVTTGAGNPGKYMNRFESAGIKVIPVVPSVALGRRMENNGAHAVIAEGNEAGGHIGKLTTMTLIPQLVDAVDIPVIAAGGIADGRGLAAALSLGAAAVQMGTRFVCCTECTASDEYKQAIIEARDRDAVVTGKSTGHPVRNLKNRLTQKMRKLEEEGISPEELEKLGSGKLREAVREGNVDEGSVMAGQISGLIREIKSAEDIIQDTVELAAEIIDINNDYFGG